MVAIVKFRQWNLEMDNDCVHFHQIGLHSQPNKKRCQKRTQRLGRLWT